MSDVAIEVKNLTKEFKIPHRKVDTVFEKFASYITGNRQSYERFLALDNISFTVKKGESVGIVGRNGSGKSTLLKLIARIINPTKGSIITNGSVMPFIELGVGFQYDITARENVFLYGAIIGLKKKQIEERYDDLVEFSELGNFMDMKLKDFSSGMVARLAFSTAIMANSDILLIDEVLAVGDIEFRKKCFEKMSEYKRKGKTILFVSHDTNMVQEMCPKCLLLDTGKLIQYDETEKVMNSYLKEIMGKKEKELLELNEKKGETEQKIDFIEQKTGADGQLANQEPKNIQIISTKMYDKERREKYVFKRGDSVKIVIYFFAKKDIEDVVFRSQIYRSSDNLFVIGTNTQRYGIETGLIHGEGKTELVYDSLPLSEGRYYINVAILKKSDEGEPFFILDNMEKSVEFEIVREPNDKIGPGILFVPHIWRVIK